MEEEEDEGVYQGIRAEPFCTAHVVSLMHSRLRRKRHNQSVRQLSTEKRRSQLSIATRPLGKRVTHSRSALAPQIQLVLVPTRRWVVT